VEDGCGDIGVGEEPHAREKYGECGVGDGDRGEHRSRSLAEEELFATNWRGE
jgi:hypothetical protein